MPDRDQDPRAIAAALLADTSAGAEEVAARQTRASRLVAQLAPVETALLERLAAGWGKREIAAALNIAEPAYESHRDSLFAKLDVGSTAAAVRIAIYAGLA